MIGVNHTDIDTSHQHQNHQQQGHLLEEFEPGVEMGEKSGHGNTVVVQIRARGKEECIAELVSSQGATPCPSLRSFLSNAGEGHHCRQVSCADCREINSGFAITGNCHEMQLNFYEAQVNNPLPTHISVVLQISCVVKQSSTKMTSR